MKPQVKERLGNLISDVLTALKTSLQPDLDAAVEIIARAEDLQCNLVCSARCSSHRVTRVKFHHYNYHYH